MDRDYQNFGERMGSFENTLEVSDDTSSHSDELKHFGKLGMKWGHHKSINSSTIGAAARTGVGVSNLGKTVNKNHYSKEALKKAQYMSDEDLKKITTRLNLENNYANAKDIQSGKGKVNSILTTGGSLLAVASSAAVLYDVIKKARSV